MGQGLAPMLEVALAQVAANLDILISIMTTFGNEIILRRDGTFNVPVLCQCQTCQGYPLR